MCIKNVRYICKNNFILRIGWNKYTVNLLIIYAWTSENALFIIALSLSLSLMKEQSIFLKSKNKQCSLSSQQPESWKHIHPSDNQSLSGREKTCYRVHRYDTGLFSITWSCVGFLMSRCSDVMTLETSILALSQDGLFTIL